MGAQEESGKAGYEETEMIRAAEALQKFMEIVSNKSAVDMEVILKTSLSYQYFFVGLETLSDPIIYNAIPTVNEGLLDDWIRNVYRWKPDIEGSVEGIALFYSVASGWFYYFVARYNEHSGQYSITVYKLEKAAVKRWISEGHFDRCLDEGTAFQLR